jgi:poly(3-hydroxyalkanoate) depolymerase
VARPRASTSSSTEFLDVEGLKLRVRVRGSGPPLLLVMGLGGNVEMWEPLTDQLRGLTTIAYDAPGTGESDTPRWPLSIRAQARVAVQIVDSLGHTDFDVLGVSYGGAVAQEMAIRHPERVRRLILAATSFGVGSVPGRLSAVALLATPYRYYSRSHLKSIAPRLYGGRIAREPELLDQHAYSRLGHAPSVRGYLWQLAAIASWTGLPFLQRIRVPVLVLAGDDDPIVRVANARILAALLPDARLVVMRGSGHLFLIDEASRSAKLIRDFLA